LLIIYSLCDYLQDIQVQETMKKTILIITLLCFAIKLIAQPIALHPKNKHIFQYKGKPTLIIGSGEHYGAVMHLDFDYKKYIATLAKDGLNTTRLFTGPYKEIKGAFGIEKNMLAPVGERYICAWARSNVPGYTEGGNKFDLDKWDDAYFVRLKDFMSECAKHDIIVEICLFTSFYGPYWKASPFYPANNINNTDDIPYKEVQTKPTPKYAAYQEAYVRKIVRELNGFDNFYLEIQNEPWADGVDKLVIKNEYLQKEDLKDEGNIWRAKYEINGQASMDWQKGIASIIRDEEKKLTKKHLISQNIANFEQPMNSIDPNVDIFNFHYASPKAIQYNWQFDRPIGFNETGFAGKKDETYRRQAWRFITSGGALFGHLDYSFYVGKEDGTATEFVAPGGGSPAFRQQLGILKKLMHQMDLVNFVPDNDLLISAGAFAYPMSNRKTQYLIYFEAFNPFDAQLKVANAGQYQLEWIDVITGKVISSEKKTTKDGKLNVKFSENFSDIVLIIRRL
jgi:DNA-dependent RNA polymerase auxiliary subunit epsilon